MNPKLMTVLCAVAALTSAFLGHSWGAAVWGWSTGVWSVSWVLEDRRG